MLTKLEMGAFAKLFNRGGYVLDFSTADFDAFTMDSTGIPLCGHYGLSKGKSMLAYLDEAESASATKFLLDLFDYYEFHFRPEFDPDAADEFSSHKHTKGMRSLYIKCKEIVDRERAESSYLQSSVRYLQEEFSSAFMNERIDLLMKMRESDPTEAIGKSKELIESCCKTILDKLGLTIEKTWTLSRLLKETMKALAITTETVTDNSREADIVRQILGSLSGLVTGVAEFRNEYGSGHGKEASFHALPVRHAKLAVGSSITLVEYLWETYEWRSTQGLS